MTRVGQIRQWVIYDHPTDIPGGFVVRPWIVEGGEIKACPVHAVAETLNGARACLPQALFNIGRMEDDDPTIVEVWI